MTNVQIAERVSQRGDAIRLIEGILAGIYWGRNVKLDRKVKSFIALDNVRAYLIKEQRKDLNEMKPTMTWSEPFMQREHELAERNEQCGADYKIQGKEW